MRRFAVTAVLALAALSLASAVPAAADERESEYTSSFEVHVGGVHIVENVDFEEEFSTGE
jgi:hypothetical protein